MQSQLTSSFQETSDDDEAKRKMQEKLEKKNKKALTEKEIDALVDIDIGETETFDLLFIPSSLVQNDTDEQTIVTTENKKYEELKANKVGSDSYNERGSQTLNLTQKNRDIFYRGFMQENKDLQATNWDIDDASKAKKMTEARQQQLDY